MRGLNKTVRHNIEQTAIALLEKAVAKHGRNIPANDCDYCEAFGLLRGAICTLGPRLVSQIRVEPGHGEYTHESIHHWLFELVDQIIAVQSDMRGNCNAH